MGMQSPEGKVVRKIVHVDMDAFFASIEQRNDPSLKGRPVAVGGKLPRGVVAAASYEARKFGVHSAMPSTIALQKCPHLVLVEPHFEEYKRISYQIREILSRFTDLIEPLSIDEAFLDVTHNKVEMRSATHIALEIKRLIRAETGLAASAGVSINKFLAKIASDVNKPDGLFVIPPEKVESFIEKLPVEKIHGIGKATAEKMRKLNIFTGKDLKDRDEYELIRQFGKTGRWFYQVARGIDERPVNPNRIRKSIGAETTFEKDLESRGDICSRLEEISNEVWDRTVACGKSGRTVTLKLRYPDFTTLTRSRTVVAAVGSREELCRIAFELLDVVSDLKKIRLVGVTLSNFSSGRNEYPKQLTIEF